MDIKTLLSKGASTVKPLDPDDKRIPYETASPTWNLWSGEEDAWEDVAEILPSRLPTTSPISSNTQLTHAPVEARQQSPPPLLTHNNPQQVKSHHLSQHDASSTESELIQTLQAKLNHALKRSTVAERSLYAISHKNDLHRSVEARSSSNDELQAKQRQIQAILAEGEKLSIRVAEKEAAAKSLKWHVKDRDALIEELRASLASSEAKLKSTTTKKNQLESSERVTRDALQVADHKLLAAQKISLSNTTNSAALDATRAQLEALRMSHATALDTQQKRLKYNYQSELEDHQAKTSATENRITNAMTELQTYLSKVINDAGQREDQLRSDLDDARALAEKLKAEKEENAAALPDATRPLVRQVSALQAAMLERSRTTSALERSYTAQLTTAEKAHVATEKREKLASAKAKILQDRASSLEKELKSVDAERILTQSQLDNLKVEYGQQRLEHENKLRETTQSLEQVSKANYEAETDLSRERTAHLNALASGNQREEILRDQLAMLQEKQQSKVQKKQKRISEMATGEAAGNLARMSGLASLDMQSGSLDNLVIQSLGIDDFEGIDDVAESASNGVLYAMDKMKLRLRKKDGEVITLQSVMRRKDAATERLAEEIVQLTGEVEELKRSNGDAPKLKQELSKLKMRHGALLELLGEREERIAELSADVDDVKQMYKEQITELLMQLENASSR